MGKKISVFLAVAAMFTFFLLLTKKKEDPKNYPAGQEKAMIEIGHHLFFDNRISFNNTKSCGSCHDPKFAFTDGYRRSVTANGESLKHNAPSLVNIQYQNYFDWANPTVSSLEKQQERPLFNDHPAELGVKGNERIILQRLKADTFYQRLFAEAFPGIDEPFNFNTIVNSISAFERTLLSFNSPYDKFINGDTALFTVSARAGMGLFFSGRLNCAACHKGPQFTLSTTIKNIDSIYINTGLYNIRNNNRYPGDDIGLAAITNREDDNGKFKIPSLRNVALTAPYMHDGSINTLDEVIEGYVNGGRMIAKGPVAGDGRINKLKDKRIRGFILSDLEKKQLIDFLYQLTDSSVLKNPAFQNPFNLPANN